MKDNILIIILILIGLILLISMNINKKPYNQYTGENPYAGTEMTEGMYVKL